MEERALSGLRVLEYGDLVSAPSCTKWMADMGAEVVKVERPGQGDVSRWLGPFRDDVVNPEASGLFLYLNTSKLGVTLDVETGEGARIFARLASDVDILVENMAPGYLDGLGLGYEQLAAINPRLVMTSISPFGQT